MGKKMLKGESSKVKDKNKRIKLWAHCISEHAVIMSPETSLKDLRVFHNDEHTGPCTIRNHDSSSLTYSLKKIGETLVEDGDYQGE